MELIYNLHLLVQLFCMMTFAVNLSSNKYIHAGLLLDKRTKAYLNNSICSFFNQTLVAQLYSQGHLYNLTLETSFFYIDIVTIKNSYRTKHVRHNK